MAWVVTTNAFVGLLAIALGIVALRTGWTVPTARRHVTTPKFHGLGALLMGASLVLHSLVYVLGDVLPIVSWEARFFGGNALLIAGMVLIVLSYLLPLRRSRSRTDPSRA
ncbi:hypothetical protein [Streptomyces mesophilus]|uniref:hypothetical protein n=1 Tax=Streptomyces mesophilus TaxID=1775132 RepID=UPI00332E7B65